MEGYNSDALDYLAQGKRGELLRRMALEEIARRAVPRVRERVELREFPIEEVIDYIGYLVRPACGYGDDILDKFPLTDIIDYLQREGYKVVDGNKPLDSARASRAIARWGRA